MPEYQKTILKIETGGHAGNVMDLLVTSDGGQLVTLGEDKTIRVWDVQHEREIRKLLGRVGSGATGQLQAIAISPNDRYIVCSAFTGPASDWGHPPYDEGDVRIRIFERCTGELVRSFSTGNTNVVSAIAFSPDGRFLLAGSEDGSITVWEFPQLQVEEWPTPFHLIQGHAEIRRPYNLRVIQTEDDYVILSVDFAEFNGNLSAYSLNRKSILLTRSANDRLQYVDTSDHLIAICGYANHVQILDHQLNLVTTIEAESRPADLAFSPDGSKLLVGSQTAPDGESTPCCVFDTTKFQMVCSVDFDATVQSVAFIDDDTFVVMGGSRQGLYLFDATSGKAKGGIVPRGSTLYSVGIKEGHIAFGRTQAYQDNQNNDAPLEQAFDLQTREIRSIDREEAESFSRAVTQSAAGRLRVTDQPWDLVLEGDEFDIAMWRSGGWYYHEAYGFTEDGKIVSGGRGGEVRIYDDRGNTVGFGQGHAARVWDLAVHGHWLVTAGEDQQILIWNLDDLTEDEHCVSRRARNQSGRQVLLFEPRR